MLSSLSPTIASRRSRFVLLASIVLVSIGAVACEPVPTSSSCALTTSGWRSAPSSTGRLESNPIVGVRAGRHDCFDRLVVSLRGLRPAGLGVRYGTVHTQGTGDAMTLAGGASLDVVVSAPAYDASGRPTWRPALRTRAVDLAGFDTLRQVAFGGSFEGMTTVGVGVRARLPFHAWTTVSDGHALLVIDIAHRWP